MCILFVKMSFTFISLVFAIVQWYMTAALPECDVLPVPQLQDVSANVSLATCDSSGTIFDIIVSWQWPFNRSTCNNTPVVGIQLREFSTSNIISVTIVNTGSTVWTTQCTMYRLKCESFYSMNVSLQVFRMMTATILGGPSIPTVGEVSEKVIQLSWSPFSPISVCDVQPNVSYTVAYHGRAHCGDETPHNSTTEFQETEYTFEDLEEYTNYTFNLTMYPGGMSVIIHAQTLAADPTGKPQMLTAKNVTDTTVELTWKREECRGRNGEITGYVVQYYDSDDVINKCIVITEREPSQIYTIDSLSPNTSYMFQVAAVNANGTGPFSEPVCIITLADLEGANNTVDCSLQAPTLTDGVGTNNCSLHDTTDDLPTSSSSAQLVTTPPPSLSVPPSTTSSSAQPVMGASPSLLVPPFTSSSSAQLVTTPSTSLSVPPSTSSSSVIAVGVVAGAAVAGVILTIITVVAIVIIVSILRRRKTIHATKQDTTLSLVQRATIISVLTNAEFEEETTLDNAAYSTVDNSAYEKVPGHAAYSTVGNSTYEKIPDYLVTTSKGDISTAATNDVPVQNTSDATPDSHINQCYEKVKFIAPTVGPYQKELQVSEGEQVTLMVEASGTPRPTITWAREGRGVEADYATELGEDGSLTLVCAKPEHTGTYHFTASNKAGSITGDVILVVSADEEQGSGLATVDSSPLEVEKIGECVSRLHACSNGGFILQYRSLPSGEDDKQVTVGSIPTNQPKNRFKHITAYDDHRIVLIPITDSEDDYINASYVDGYARSNKYIATQGPLPNTVVDFWRLVWQEKVQAIAMLTNVTEGVQRKCEQYWPESKQSEVYGPFEVTVVDQKVFADYTIRVIQLEQSGMVGVHKKVIQFHFTSWPDHGVPEYAGPLLTYRHKIQSKYRPSKGPLLVHCSAGVGRTGTLIAIDIALEQAAKDGVVDIAGIVSKMRGQRMKMVQTAEQYVFIHDAVLESLVCGDTHISASKLKVVMETLNRSDKLTGKTGFEKQFHVLDQVTPKPNEVVRSAALKHHEKNRDTNFLPPDKWRVTLKSETSDYIHASYANGYKQSKRFIIAQAPMKSTVCDFWKMVYERECGVIVMLSDLIKDQKMCFPYWPEVDKLNAQKYGEYAVSTIGFVQHDGYSQRVFHITDQQSGEVHKVTQFQMADWTPEGVCINHRALLALIDHVIAEQMKTGNMPIVVHGIDTVSRCGIFCALMNAMECCKTEGTVDVFQVVKALCIQKPGAVPTVEQYCSIFDVMLLFLETLDVYSNVK